jgi:hypothetical protein
MKTKALLCFLLLHAHCPVPGSLDNKKGGEEVPSFINQKVASSSDTDVLVYCTLGLVARCDGPALSWTIQKAERSQSQASQDSEKQERKMKIFLFVHSEIYLYIIYTIFSMTIVFFRKGYH